MGQMRYCIDFIRKDSCYTAYAMATTTYIAHAENNTFIIHPPDSFERSREKKMDKVQLLFKYSIATI